MKIIYEPVQNFGYLFTPQHAFNLTSNYFKHLINFELKPVDDLSLPKLKIIY